MLYIGVKNRSLWACLTIQYVIGVSKNIAVVISDLVEVSTIIMDEFTNNLLLGTIFLIIFFDFDL